MRQEHLGQIVQAVSAVEQMGTVNAVYFVACGGSPGSFDGRAVYF